MEKRLVRIGNSMAVVLDQNMRKKLGIDDRVDIQLLKGHIVITKPAKQLPGFDAFIDKLEADCT